MPFGPPLGSGVASTDSLLMAFEYLRLPCEPLPAAPAQTYTPIRHPWGRCSEYFDLCPVISGGVLYLCYIIEASFTLGDTFAQMHAAK